MSEGINLRDLLLAPEFEEASFSSRRYVEAGETIIKKGDKSCDVYLILSGQVSVLGEVDLDQQRHIKPGVSELSKGDVFGELSMFDHKPRSATVIAAADTLLAVIDGQGLMAYFDQHPDVGYPALKSLLLMMAGRLRSADKRMLFLFSWGLKAHGINGDL